MIMSMNLFYRAKSGSMMLVMEKREDTDYFTNAIVWPVVGLAGGPQGIDSP